MLCTATLLASCLAAQQAAKTSVKIMVTDPSGAGIPHAQVRIVPALDELPKMETDDKGQVIVQLRPRDYAVIVQIQGFRKSVTHFNVKDSSELQTVAAPLQLASGGHVEGAAEASKDKLTLVSNLYHVSATLSSAELKGMPHIMVTVHNSHSNADETYSGVRLADLLAKMGAPVGGELRGEALASYVVATGSDGYKTVLAIGEVDPEFHPGEAIVADAMNGKPLDAHSGPFKLVVTEDKHPARAVRNLATIELSAVP